MEKLVNAVEDMTREVEGLRSDFKQGANSNSSSININAGGIGVWIATVSCAVMLGLGVAGMAIIIDQNRQIGELQAYLSAIYMQAPQLKPESEE